MKVIGSDYDGTLTYGGINETKLLSIQKWRKAGHKFGIITGRGKNFREELIQQFPRLQLDFFAACNGACIMDENGAVVYEARCSEVIVSELLAELFGYGCKYAHIGCEKYLCVAENRENIPSYVSEDAARLLKECPHIDHFYQISVQLPSAEEALAVVEKINSKYSKWLNPLQNGRCIDIVSAGLNKAQGMYRVMEFFGCVHQDVITVGDNVNDIDMIRSFRSYAMESGVEETKKIADGVVSDVTEVIERELSF